MNILITWTILSHIRNLLLNQADYINIQATNDVIVANIANQDVSLSRMLTLPA